MNSVKALAKIIGVADPRYINKVLMNTAWVGWDNIQLCEPVESLCPSGVLMAVPVAVPAEVLSWRYIGRLVLVSVEGSGCYRPYLCLDDLLKASISVPPPMSKGFRRLEELNPLVHTFSILLSRLVHTGKSVGWDERERLALDIASAVSSWLKRVMGSAEDETRGSG